MTTAREYLDRYNALATEMGRPTLKGPWKSSTTSIQARYNALSNEYNEMRAHQEKMNAARDAVNADTVTLANIARSIGLAPKDARAKARRHANLFGAYEVAKHEYPMKDADAIVELLKADHRKK